MSETLNIKSVALSTLLERVRDLQTTGFRLVQISATRLPEQFELTYSFDLNRQLTSLRLLVSASEARIPSISSIYGCAVLYENEMHDLFNIQVDGMTIDFKGNFYKTAVKHPFNAPKPPPAQATPPAKPASAAPSSAAK